MLLLLTLLGAASAQSATILVPEFADDDPSEALRARSELLKSVGSVPGLAIAPLSKFKKLAKSARLDPKDLGNAKAAQTLGKVGHLDGVLSGAVEEVGDHRTLHILFHDAKGTLAYKRDVELANGEMRQDQADRVATGLAGALGLEDAGPRRAIHVANGEAPNPSDPDAPDPEDTRPPVRAVKRLPTVPAPEINEERDERQQTRASQHLEAAPELVEHSPDELQRLERYEDAAFELSLGLRGSQLSTQLVANAKGRCTVADNSGCVSQLSSSLYPGFTARLSTFPFHGRLDVLSGLGLIAGGSFSVLNIATGQSGSSGSFTANDLRLYGDLVWRVRLPILSGESGIYAPSLGVRVGERLWNFDPNNATAANAAQVYPLDRTAPQFAGEILEPLGHYVRLVLSAEVLLSPYPGSTIEKQLMSLQTFSTGYGLSGEVQGHFGAPNSSALTGSFKVSYESFGDCLEVDQTNHCYYNNSQTSLDLALMLGYAFY